MTNEELDCARVEEAWNKYNTGHTYDTVELIAARLAREGWTPPEVVDLEVGSIWKHYNGGVYEVIAIANTLDTEKYPKAVIHKGVNNGLVWTRRADDWHRSYTQQAKTSETPVDPDLAEAEAIWFEGMAPFDLVLAGIKRGRALAAEAKPGMVWVKHDGSGECPVDLHHPILIKNIKGCYAEGVARVFIWHRVTHYAIINPPEEDVA